MDILIDKKEVKNHDVSSLFHYAMHDGNSDYFHFTDKNFLDQHALKLYAYLSHKFNNSVILDIGTKFGNSAIAFSHNDNNKIITYDLIKWPCHTNLKKSNIEMKIGNFMEDINLIDYSKVSIILIDVDPHDGSQEPVMIEYLKNIGWSGLLLLDDIAWDDFPILKEYWNSLDYEKYDLTDVGHFSGTGIINFGGKHSIRIIE